MYIPIISPKSLYNIKPTQVCTNLYLVTVQYRTITWISSSPKSLCNIKQSCIYIVQCQINTRVYQVLVFHSASSSIDVYYKLSYVTFTIGHCTNTGFLSFASLLVWCCITPLSTILQLYYGVSFIRGRNRRTRRKPPTCRKSLTNFIPKCYLPRPKSRFELITSAVIGTDWRGSCKSNYHTMTTTTTPCLPATWTWIFVTYPRRSVFPIVRETHVLRGMIAFPRTGKFITFLCYALWFARGLCYFIYTSLQSECMLRTGDLLLRVNINRKIKAIRKICVNNFMGWFKYKCICLLILLLLLLLLLLVYIKISFAEDYLMSHFHGW